MRLVLRMDLVLRLALCWTETGSGRNTLCCNKESMPIRIIKMILKARDIDTTISAQHFGHAVRALRISWLAILKRLKKAFKQENQNLTVLKIWVLVPWPMRLSVVMWKMVPSCRSDCWLGQQGKQSKKSSRISIMALPEKIQQKQNVGRVTRND